MNRKLLEATATLTGCIIGAGILGIPYVVSRAGFLTGILNIIIIGVLFLIIHLYLGEVLLRTKGTHQLTGYAEKYLGRKGKIFMTLYMIFAIYGAITAYLIMSGEFLSQLFKNTSFGFTPFVFSIIVFIIIATMVYLGLNVVERSELVMMFLLLGIVLLLAVICIPKINIENLKELSIKKFFIPYGVVLFAFLGEVALPEMLEEVNNEKKLLKKAIIFGSLIPMIVYILFSFLIVGVSGSSTTQNAFTGLLNFVNPITVKIGLVMGLTTITTSFLVLGLALKEMYVYDFKLNKNLAWFLALFIPLFIFLSGIKDFIEVLSVTGALTGGIVGILIVFMHRKSIKLGDRKPEFEIKSNIFVDVILIMLFVFGIIYQILDFFGLLVF
ncbi:MAG: aromatic amino acid transport family protein [Candidatus Woesearchaeota archaeon]